MVWWFALLACGVSESEPPSPSGAVDGVDTAAPADTGELASFDLSGAVQTDALLGHLDAFGAIAEAHGGNRSAGQSGYLASVEYVEQVLADNGYTTWREAFDFTLWEVLGPASLQLGDVSYEEGRDITALGYSPGGRASGPLQAVDLLLPPSNQQSSTSGCEASDFEGFVAGSVALLQRGSCTFHTKAVNAQNAGAVAVVVFNEGQAGRQDLVQGTLEETPQLTLPVLGATYDVGLALSERQGETVTVEADTELVVVETYNVLADRPGSSEEVLVVGAHLDSVPGGPGINDNGTGSAALLEMAVQMAEADFQPHNTVRFAWWGAEEWGLLGSIHHVQQRSDAELASLSWNLNFDMIGSPNGFRMVMDHDGSDTQPYVEVHPENSSLEDLFQSYFDANGLDWAPTQVQGRTDYAAFAYSGIPVGGLFTGSSEERLRPNQAESTGGSAGDPMDPCYHQSCDDPDNVDAKLYTEVSRAAAYAVQILAEDAHQVGARRGPVARPSAAVPHLTHEARR